MKWESDEEQGQTKGLGDDGSSGSCTHAWGYAGTTEEQDSGSESSESSDSSSGDGDDGSEVTQSDNEDCHIQ
ncbi:hypothetical protein HDV00_009110, partial [Rhizophlyctis rosea]